MRGDHPGFRTKLGFLPYRAADQSRDVEGSALARSSRLESMHALGVRCNEPGGARSINAATDKSVPVFFCVFADQEAKP